jgi:hypothetical protein
VDVIAEMPVVKAGTQNGDKIKKLTRIRTQLGPVVNPRSFIDAVKHLKPFDRDP